MNADDIDRILSHDDTIKPSTGFLNAVMSAVEREASMPPLAFPWARVLPAFIAAGIAFFALTWEAIFSPVDPVVAESFVAQIQQVTAVAADIGLQWVVLALALTIVSVVLPMSLVSRGTRQPVSEPA